MRVKNMTSSGELCVRSARGGEGGAMSSFQWSYGSSLPCAARCIRPSKVAASALSVILPPSGSPPWCPAMENADKSCPMHQHSYAPAVAWSTCFGSPRNLCWNAAEYLPISWSNPAASASVCASKGCAKDLASIAVPERWEKTDCVRPSSEMCAR